MKQVFSIFSFILCLIIFSCDNNPNGNPKRTDSTKNETNLPNGIEGCMGGYINFHIPEAEGNTMINDFDSIYRQFGIVDSLMSEVWVDSIVIVKLSEYLEAHKEYDGIRIYNCACDPKDPMCHNRKYDIESSIFQLTKPSTHHMSVSDKFDFPKGVRTEFKNFNLEGRSNGLRYRFNHIFRRSLNEDDADEASVKALSKGVWFASCVIKEISNQLKNTQNKLDGVRVYGGAYKAKIANGQFDDHQSTFILVLTSRKGSEHINRWDVAKDTDSNFNNKFDDGFNHGELCPDYCQ